MDSRIAVEKQRYESALSTIAQTMGISSEDVLAIPHSLESVTAHLLVSANMVFVSGVSGAGKSTVVSALEAAGYERLPNVVTRARRIDEPEDACVFTDEATFTKWEAAGELFHPHMRNGTRHAIRLSDIARAQSGRRMYADKSVSSTDELVASFSELANAVRIYIFAPSFDELFERIRERETRTKSLTEAAILDRFEEEVGDMLRTQGKPYVFVVNDDRARIKSAVQKVIRSE